MSKEQCKVDREIGQNILDMMYEMDIRSAFLTLSTIQCSLAYAYNISEDDFNTLMDSTKERYRGGKGKHENNNSNL